MKTIKVNLEQFLLKMFIDPVVIRFFSLPGRFKSMVCLLSCDTTLFVSQVGIFKSCRNFIIETYCIEPSKCRYFILEDFSYCMNKPSSYTLTYART